MWGRKILLRKIAQASASRIKGLLTSARACHMTVILQSILFVSTRLPAEFSVNLGLFSRETKSTNIETSRNNNVCLSIIGKE